MALEDQIAAAQRWRRSPAAPRDLDLGTLVGAPETGWITDRLPEEADAGLINESVLVPSRSGKHTAVVPWHCVYPGTPWAPF